MLTFVNSSMMFYHDPMGPSPSTEPPMEVQHPSGEYCRHFTASKYCVICAQSPVTGARDSTTNGCGPLGRPQMPPDKYRPEIPQINLRAPPDAHTHPVSPHPTAHTPLTFLPHDPQSSPPVSTPRPSEQGGLIPTSMGQMPNVSMPLPNMSVCTNTLVVPQPIMKPGSHRSIKTYHCRMCDQEFESKSDMQRHAKDVHRMEDKGHKCPNCYKSFPSSQQLAQHSLVHTNIRKYQCKYCDKAFKQLSHVQQHQRTHTGEHPYKCTVEGCTKAFAQLSSLQCHMKNHTNKANLKSCFDKWSSQGDPEEGYLGERPYKCNAEGCDKSFAQLSNLQCHMKNHLDKTNVSERKPYCCRVCDRRFATEASLNNHMSKLHTTLARPHDLTCQVCEKQCFSDEKFYKHMHKYHPDYWRVFAGDRPLTDFLGNQPQREVKHREKPYMCQICHKKYSHETGLLKHMGTHPEYKSDPSLKMTLYSCTVCDKLFTRESYLERHMEMKVDEQHAAALATWKRRSTPEDMEQFRLRDPGLKDIAKLDHFSSLRAQQSTFHSTSALSRPNSTPPSLPSMRDFQSPPILPTFPMNTFKQEQNIGPVRSFSKMDNLSYSFRHKIQEDLQGMSNLGKLNENMINDIRHEHGTLSGEVMTKASDFRVPETIHIPPKSPVFSQSDEPKFINKSPHLAKPKSLEYLSKSPKLYERNNEHRYELNTSNIFKRSASSPNAEFSEQPNFHKMDSGSSPKPFPDSPKSQGSQYPSSRSSPTISGGGVGFHVSRNAITDNLGNPNLVSKADSVRNNSSFLSRTYSSDSLQPTMRNDNIHLPRTGSYDHDNQTSISHTNAVDQNTVPPVTNGLDLPNHSNVLDNTNAQHHHDTFQGINIGESSGSTVLQRADSQGHLPMEYQTHSPDTHNQRTPDNRMPHSLQQGSSSENEPYDFSKTSQPSEQRLIQEHESPRAMDFSRAYPSQPSPRLHDSHGQHLFSHLMHVPRINREGQINRHVIDGILSQQPPFPHGLSQFALPSNEERSDEDVIRVIETLSRNARPYR